MSIQLTIPTKISLLRIPLGAVFFILIWHSYFVWAFIVFLISAITDGLDGYLAKNKAMQSNIGRVIDPVADRIFISLSFIATYFGPLKYTMSLWVFGFVIMQDLLLGLLGLITFIYKGRLIDKVSIPGKIATLLQEIFIPVVLISNIIDYRFSFVFIEAAVIATSLISGGHHLYLWIKIWRS